MAKRPRAARGRIPLPILILGGVLLAAALSRTSGVWPAVDAEHPEPRADAKAVALLPAADFQAFRQIARAYREAAEIPDILDGLHCHCGCRPESAHRSLLSCFESEHAFGCDVCLMEASLAYRMHTAGETLRAIRDAADDLFNAS